MFSILASILFINPTKSYAAPLISKTFPDPNASTNYPLYMTIGTGEFDGSVAAAVIISDSPGVYGLIIDEAQWCNTNSAYSGYGRALDLPKRSDGYTQPYFSTNFNVFNYNVGGNSLGASIGSLSTGYVANCVARTAGFTFTLGPSNFNPTTGKYSALFIANVSGIKNPLYGGVAPAAAENSFRLTIGGPGNPGLTFLPASVSGIPSFFNISNRNRPNNSVADYNLDFTLPCSITTAKGVSIRFADADNGVYQQSAAFPMALTITLTPGYPTTIITGGNGTTGAGLSPSYPATLQPATPYALRIDGLSYINAITYNVTIDPSLITASNNCPSQAGYIDSCQLVAGNTIFYGWAWSSTATTSSDPTVNLAVGGTPSPSINNLASDIDYRTPDVENWLNNNKPGQPKIPNYGFQWNAGQLTKGNSYTISGIIAGGTALGINTASTAPPNGVGYGFPGNAVPQECMAVQNVTIQGTIMNAYDVSLKYSGLTVNTCVAGVSATTNSNGYYSFTVPKGTSFCVYVGSALPIGANGSYVRPWTVGYTVLCPAFDVTTRTPKNYCTAPNPTTTPSGSLGRYDNQVAGLDGANGYDRWGDVSFDGGYDFALTFPTSISCTLTPDGTAETLTTYVPNISVKNGGTVGTPPITNGTTLVQINDPTTPTTSNGNFPDLTYSSSAYSPTGTPSFIMTPSALPTPPTPGPYTVAATVSGQADGSSVSNTCTTTINRANLPYLKTYGADVWAGGSYNASACATDGGGIYTYSNGSGTNAKGSSGQLGVMALLDIKGFYSSSLKGSGTTTPIKGSTFSNTAGNGTYGGAFGGKAACMPDYYTRTQDTTISAQSIMASSVSFSAGKSRYTLSGPLTINALSVLAGSQVAVYVDGDVYIKGNITYGTGANTQDQLPYLAIIATGNIYIDPTVTRIDGLLIAQPKDLTTTNPTDGRIYTCAPNGVAPSDTDLYTKCSSQLVINGALVAQQVKFMRTFKSLKDSSPVETPNFATGEFTNAAEVINYTPEMYLAPSPLRDPNQTTKSSGIYGKYDAVFSLPPVY